MNQFKKNAKPSSPDDFDFFITTGDNLYPLIPNYPSDIEFKRLQNLFESQDSLKDIPIYPVRGNHDAQFKDDREIQLSQNFPQWKMKANYYTTEFEVGANGEKMVLMHIDSPYLLCETVGKDHNRILSLSE